MLSGIHVEDVAAGITLAAEQGRIGESYLLAGDPITLREILQLWGMAPGSFRVRFYLPRWLASLLFAPLEPSQRLVGLPAFVSRETVSASVPLAFSSAKAQHELGWSYRPAQTIWHETINEEIRLLAIRQKRDLVSRLKPLAVVETTNGNTDRNRARNEVVSRGNAASTQK
jgi:nucleoside-diphosphate-sugar epimerase